MPARSTGGPPIAKGYLEGQFGPGDDTTFSSGGTFAAGLGPSSYGSGPLPLLTFEDLMFDNRLGSQHTLIVAPRGGPTYSVSVARGSAHMFEGRGIASITIDAVDASAQWEKRVHGGFVSEHASAKANVSIGDNATRLIQFFANGTVVVADGIAHVAAFVTAGAVTLTDGTNSAVLAVPGTNISTITASTYVHFVFPVLGGTTYTLSGTGLVLLGGKINVQVA